MVNWKIMMDDIDVVRRRAGLEPMNDQKNDDLNELEQAYWSEYESRLRSLGFNPKGMNEGVSIEIDPSTNTVIEEIYMGSNPVRMSMLAKLSNHGILNETTRLVGAISEHSPTGYLIKLVTKRRIDLEKYR